MGHLAIGDRRGWLLLVLQPLAIAALLVVGAQLIDGTRWLVVLVPLLALLVIWLAQAIHAHQSAVRQGAQPGGELQVVFFLPLALIVLTLFWLIGGRHGSPAATVEAYIAAWMDARADVAAELYAVARPRDEVIELWRADDAAIARSIADGRALYGAASGLDPARPFNSLRVRQADSPDGRARFVVDVVRGERFQTTVLGVIPTAGQRTVIVRPMLEIILSEVDTQGATGLLTLPTTAWRIESVEDVQP